MATLSVLSFNFCWWSFDKQAAVISALHLFNVSKLSSMIQILEILHTFSNFSNSHVLISFGRIGFWFPIFFSFTKFRWRKIGKKLQFVEVSSANAILTFDPSFFPMLFSLVLQFESQKKVLNCWLSKNTAANSKQSCNAGFSGWKSGKIEKEHESGFIGFRKQCATRTRAQD